MSDLSLSHRRNSLCILQSAILKICAQTILLIIQFIAALIWAAAMLKRYRNTLRNYFATFEDKSVKENIGILLLFGLAESVK